MSKTDGDAKQRIAMLLHALVSEFTSGDKPTGSLSEIARNSEYWLGKADDLLAAAALSNEIVIKQIKAAVETVASRNQDEWAFANGHRDQKWESISDERLKEGWRWRVSVAEVIRELEEND